MGGRFRASVMANELDNAEKGAIESLRWTLDKMREALDKPVIEAKDFEREHS